ncbi:MAG: hypothetical protein FWG61_04550, partial [Firmicutes bacterium]|nr:hypothetical protein [Bacillota bacterium]
MKKKYIAITVIALLTICLIIPIVASAGMIGVRPADLPASAIELDATFTNSTSGNNALIAIWQDIDGVYVLVDRNPSNSLNNNSKLNGSPFVLIKTYSETGIPGLKSIKKDNVFDLIVFRDVIVSEQNKLELWVGNGTGNSVINGTELKIVGLIKVTYYDEIESDNAIDLDFKQVLGDDFATFTIKGIGDTEKLGYKFSHWVDKDGNIYDLDDEIEINEDLDLFAVWEEDPTQTKKLSYTVEHYRIDETIPFAEEYKPVDVWVNATTIEVISVSNLAPTGYEQDSIDHELPCDVNNGEVIKVFYKKVIFKVTWVDEDGTVLDTENYYYGDMPSYKKAEPTKTATAQYTFAFSGWDP